MAIDKLCRTFRMRIDREAALQLVATSTTGSAKDRLYPRGRGPTPS